jgi:hypothetical protein
MTETDASAEGYYALLAFHQAWHQLYSYENGEREMDRVVTVIEFGDIRWRVKA